MTGLGAQAEVVLRHNAGHQLTLKVVGEVRGDRAVYQFGELLEGQANVLNGVVVSLFDDGLKRLIWAGFGKFGDAAGDGIDNGGHRVSPSKDSDPAPDCILDRATRSRRIVVG